MVREPGCSTISTSGVPGITHVCQVFADAPAPTVSTPPLPVHGSARDDNGAVLVVEQSQPVRGGAATGQVPIMRAVASVEQLANGPIRQDCGKLKLMVSVPPPLVTTWFPTKSRRPTTEPE